MMLPKKYIYLHPAHKHLASPLAPSSLTQTTTQSSLVHINKVHELEEINRVLVEQTTNKFKKIEEDLLRVE